MSCKKKDMPYFEVIGTLTRFDQTADGDVICCDYKSIVEEVFFSSLLCRFLR